jgi:hypothetical protein
MMVKQSLPKFRLEALEEKFADNLTLSCDILKEHGDVGTLYYDIRRMMKLMKLEHR